MSMRVWKSVSSATETPVVELGVGAARLAQAHHGLGEGGRVGDGRVAADAPHRLVHADLVAQPLGLAQDVVSGRVVAMA